MALLPIDLPPGIQSDGTNYSARNYWADCDKIRFRGGRPERIRGWTKHNSTALIGRVRLISQWTDLSNVRHLGVGTRQKYYIDNNTGTLDDKTPLRAMPLPTDPFNTTTGLTTIVVNQRAHGLATGNRVLIAGVTSAVNGIPITEINKVHTITVTGADTYTVSSTTTAGSTAAGGGSTVTVYANDDFFVPLAASPFSFTNASTTVTVTHTAHGAAINDFVTFAGATAAAGLTINGAYQITSIVDANTYTITASSAANSTTTGGGSVVVAKYEMNTGAENYSTGSGWGAGAWGGGVWGTSSGYGFGTQARVWSADQFAEDHIACPRGGPIFYYDVSTAERLTDIRLLSGAANCPTAANFIMVGPEDRRVFAFGCSDYTTGTFDPMLIRWSDEEDAGLWTINSTTSAGLVRLSAGSEIICAVKAKGEILVWTDTALYSLRFNDEFVYGATLISPNTDIIGPNAVMAVDDTVYWMGRENFFAYNGRVQVMPCSVRQKVFSNIDSIQSYKVCAGSNRLFREVWWFYPAQDSAENDKYVVFNYAENLWYYGTLERTSWSDSGFGAFNFPIASDHDGYLYYHESGLDDGSTSPATAIHAWIKSGPIEMDSGNRFSFVRRIIPDITFAESEESEPSVTMSITPKDYPGSSDGTDDEETISRTTELPVERFTTKKDIRVRGRQIIMMIESNEIGVMWRLGINRIDVRPDGAR